MQQWTLVEGRLPESNMPAIAYYKTEYGNHKIIRAIYCAPFTVEQHEDGLDDADYDDNKDMYFVKEGWYEFNENEGVHYTVDGNITHWMRLPEPPNGGGKNSI